MSGVHYLGGNGGFSGARLWRCRLEIPVPLPSGATTPELCLRRWPANHPQPAHLVWIHHILEIATRRGCEILPVPISSRQGITMVESGGYLFELTPWLPGSADFHDHPSNGRLAAALRALAQFHLAATLPQDQFDLANVAKFVEPTGIEGKFEVLNRYLGKGREAIAAAVRLATGSELVTKSDAEFMLQHFRRFAPSVADRMAQILPPARHLPRQPCIRDIWHDHLLFTGDRVTGLVDFGAMRMDTVATDVARLLGSLVRHDHLAWQQGINAYQTLRPLSALEQNVCAVSHLATLLMSGMNWLQWLYVEGRTFDAMDAVRQRIYRCREDLAQLESWMKFFHSQGID